MRRKVAKRYLFFLTILVVSSSIFVAPSDIYAQGTWSSPTIQTFNSDGTCQYEYTCNDVTGPMDPYGQGSLAWNRTGYSCSNPGSTAFCFYNILDFDPGCKGPNSGRSDASIRTRYTYACQPNVAQSVYDFSLANGGNKSVIQGQSTTNTVTATLTSIPSSPVSFSVSGLPIGATASFSPVSCSPTCTTTITVSTQSSTPAGTYILTVAGAMTPQVTCDWGYEQTGNQACPIQHYSQCFSSLIVPTGTVDNYSCLVDGGQLSDDAATLVCGASYTSKTSTALGEAVYSCPTLTHNTSFVLTVSPPPACTQPASVTVTADTDNSVLRPSVGLIALKLDVTNSNPNSVFFDPSSKLYIRWPLAYTAPGLHSDLTPTPPTYSWYDYRKDGCAAAVPFYPAGFSNCHYNPQDNSVYTSAPSYDTFAPTQYYVPKPKIDVPFPDEYVTQNGTVFPVFDIGAKVSSLASGQTYSLMVGWLYSSARDLSQLNLSADVDKVTQAASCLPPPTNVVATTGACHSYTINVTWDRIPLATGYKIYRTGGTQPDATYGTTLFPIPNPSSGARVSFTVAVSYPNSLYGISVSAVYGTTETASSPVSPYGVVSPDICPAPLTVSASSVCSFNPANGNATVTWGTPLASATNPLQSYKVEVRKSSSIGMPVQTSALLPLAQTSYNVSNLPTDFTYFFKVIANYTNAGTGSASDSVDVITCKSSAVTCSFYPPNQGASTFPVVGIPVTLSLSINSGTSPFGIYWTDSDGLDYREATSSDTTRSYKRVYSTVGRKKVKVVVTDSNGGLLGPNIVTMCSMGSDLGPNVRVSPRFDEP